jgi:tetratricopeptide (TPR) repeat protein
MTARRGWPQCPPLMVAVVACGLAIGCNSDRREPQRPAQAAVQTDIQAVPLPDLSNTAASVRDQVRDRYAMLKPRADDEKAASADRGAAYGELGKLFLAAEFREQAEKCLLNAEALAPADMRWPYYLGHLYKQRGDGTRSIAAFERALKLKADDVPTLVWLGSAYVDQGNAQAAGPILAKAVSLQPRSVAALIASGRAAVAMQDYPRAVQSLEQALAIDPLATIAHYPLAMAYRAMGDREKAEAHLRQRGTLAVKPDDPLMKEVDTLLNSALAYEVGGADALDRADWQRAIDDFRKGIALAPNEPSLHHKLGTALALSGDVPGAYEQFQEAIRLSPKFAKAHYSLGVIEEGAGRHQEAIQHLTAAVKADPDYVEARLQLANALRRSGHFAESLAEYDRAAAGDPRVAEARFGSAAALVRLKRFAEARDRLTQAMAIFPNEPGFARALARLLAAAPDDRVRDGRRAAELMQALRATQGRDVELLETMAMVAAETGQFGDAVMWQREAIAEAQRNGQRGVAAIISDRLPLYEARRPCREPWRAQEPIEFAAMPDAPAAAPSRQ